MVIILSGPSGVGKDTLIDMWMEKNPTVKRVVTATTRAPRPGEINGQDYHFYTLEEMEDKIQNGDFLEHMNVFGDIYGTPRSSVDSVTQEGGVPIIRIDVQGAIELIPKIGDAVSVFIMPPSLEELRKRIEGRKTDTAEKIAERMETAIAEIACAYFYDHQVVNNDLEEACKVLDGILAGQESTALELAEECAMTPTLTQRTRERFEKFVDMAVQNGVCWKNPQNTVDIP